MYASSFRRLRIHLYAAAGRFDTDENNRITTDKGADYGRKEKLPRYFQGKDGMALENGRVHSRI